MKALVGAFNQEKALSRGLLRNCTTGCGTDGSFYSSSQHHGHPHQPHLDGEDERILGELLRRVGEGEVAVQTQPRVVKPETHEGKQKVDLLVNLGNCVSNVLKMYKMYEDISSI